MKRTWLLFAQAVTVLLAAWFVVVTLKPQWLDRGSKSSLGGVVSVVEAPASGPSIAAPGSFAAAAKKASPAVVSINTSKAARRNPRSNDPWFRFFFGDQGEDQPQIGLGSGVIVSADGYILTNNHVVDGADEIEITLNDSRHVRAKVVGTDPDTDLAVLKIELDKLPVIVLGNSDNLQVGDQVLAIGNPFGVGQTVTSGIVSALGRNQLRINNFENFIQTDAAINPGNSGGALIDARGNLVGINTAIYSRSGGSLGIGFAIPVSTGRQVMEQLITSGGVTRGYIGVEPQDVTPELADAFKLSRKDGVIIAGVVRGGPAARAGIRTGDIVTEVDGTSITDTTTMLNLIAQLPPGREIVLKLARANQQLEIKLQVATRPRPQREGPVE
ncbi:MAG: Do family serine endopeptidase [Burkholderiaceae bacterium]